MSQWELQVQENAAAIQQILALAKKIGEHSLLGASLEDNDVILLERNSDGTTVSVTVSQIRGSGAKETFTATADQTVFNLSGGSVSVSVFLGRTHLVENVDYTYSGGVVTLNEGAIVGQIVTVLTH